MQREDVERLCAALMEAEEDPEIVFRDEDKHHLPADAAAALRALLDRAERAEAMLAAKTKVNHELIRGQAEILAANHRLKAERDAALAAGQEEMRERAAKLVVDLTHSIRLGHVLLSEQEEDLVLRPIRETARSIRNLPIQPRP